MKQKDHKIVIKFKNTCKSKRSNNNVSIFSDTDKSLIEHIENSIQTMSILKEIMVKVSDLLKINFSLKEKSEVISSINIELMADNCVDTFDEMDDIHELTPTSQMRKNENVKFLKVTNKNTTSFFEQSDISSKKHTLNAITKDINNSKNESFLGLNKSQPLSFNIKDFPLNGGEITKDQNNEENLEEDILKPFMKQFEKYKLVLKPCPLETIRSRGAREDDTKYQPSPVKKIRDKRNSIVPTTSLKELANILRTEKERILRLEFDKKSNSLKNMNLKINDFPKRDKEQYFESKTKTITYGFLGLTNENNGAESPFTRKCQTNIVMGCSCKKVLLVDDENFNIAAVKSLLGSFEVDTDECFNGKELIDKLLQNQSKLCCQLQYTLIFLDLMMPVMGGFEAILKIQELVRCSSLKVVPNIIVLTAHDTARIKEKIVSATFVKDFVAKPVRKSKINELLSKYFFNN
jgi:CheY-like chemotaxis protein